MRRFPKRLQHECHVTHYGAWQQSFQYIPRTVVGWIKIHLNMDILMSSAVSANHSTPYISICISHLFTYIYYKYKKKKYESNNSWLAICPAMKKNNMYLHVLCIKHDLRELIPFICPPFVQHLHCHRHSPFVVRLFFFNRCSIFCCCCYFHYHRHHPCPSMILSGLFLM